MEDPITYDMSQFGWREMKLAAELLNAYASNKPEWLGNGVKLAMNRNSGFVFLTDEDYNVGLMNGDKLDMWLSTPYHGHEGFLEDLLDEYKPDDLNGDDAEYLKDMIVILNYRSVPSEWQSLIDA
jgi:hypothetical protein